MARKTKDKAALLTPLELEVMSQLWRATDGATVHEVAETLPEYAYTTLSTILRILLQKGFVEAQPSGRQHIYKPLTTKDDYESRTLKHVVTTVFDGEPASLMRRLIDDKALSKKELDEIRKLLERK